MKSKDKKRAAAAIEQRKLDKALGKYFSQANMVRVRKYKAHPEDFSEDEAKELEDIIKHSQEILDYMRKNLLTLEKYEIMERKEEEELQKKRLQYERAMKAAVQKSKQLKKNNEDKTE